MTNTSQPPKRLAEVLRYNPDTGHFHWLIRTHGQGGVIRPGDEAGTLSHGYIAINLDKVIYRAHRLAWYIMTGEWLPTSQDIDHINGNRADNRWANLRPATRAQNNLNNHNVRSDNKSGHPGVSWKTHRSGRGCWHARIYMKGRVVWQNNFEKLDEAIAARQAAERRYFGEFAPERK